MEDKTHYGLVDGTLVAATTPIGKPAPRGLTAVDVEYLVDELTFVGASCGKDPKAGLDENRLPCYYDGVKAALRLAIRRINRMEHKRWLSDGCPREGGDQA